MAIVVGSREPERARATADRLRERVPGGSFAPDANGPAAERWDVVLACDALRKQSETCG